jgi:hypothetical protein
MGRKLPNGASCADLALPSPGGTRIVSRVHAHFKHTPEDGWSITVGFPPDQCLVHHAPPHAHHHTHLPISRRMARCLTLCDLITLIALVYYRTIRVSTGLR